MVSSNGASSGSSSCLFTNSGSDEVCRAVLDQKKRKRMLSNRESARRSRMRKQKHLNDLMAQMSQLCKENSQIRTTLNLSTQHYLSVEADNSVLRTQVMELTSRLNSLNGILQNMNMNSSSVEPQRMVSECFINPWSYFLMNQTIMPSPNMLQYS